MSSAPEPDIAMLSGAKAEAAAILGSLTDRQRDVIERKAKLETNDEIAYELGIHRRSVEERILGARKKLSAKNTTDAIRKFIVLLTILEEPTCGFVRVELDRDDIEKLLRDLSFERATELLSSELFEEFMQAYRSTGLEALNAKYGFWWKPLAGLVVAALILIVAILGFAAVPVINQHNAEQPSNP